MSFRENAIIEQTACLAQGVYEMWLHTTDIAKAAKPGQFISVYTQDGARLLPRPISICALEGNLLRIVYRVVGYGTKAFSMMQEKDKLLIQGPLGNGYDVEAPYAQKKAILFGGGIGIPPMLELAKQLPCEKDIILGYKDELFLQEEFKPYGNVIITTEDGSAGIKGNVLDAVLECHLKADVLYACGPLPMLRAVKGYALENNMKCYISLEEKMACGIGACLACVCQSTDIDAHSKVKNKRICKEGPVFDAGEVMLNN